MLIPLRHENLRGRRWPVITIGLIALNLLVFLGTHWQIEEQAPKRAEVRIHLLLLAFMHPELKIPDNAGEFITDFKEKNPSVQQQVSSENRRTVDAWDTRIRLIKDPDQLQQEMDSLSQQFADQEKASILSNYAFVPAHPQPVSYITANFLHGGWLHLIGNMWFLWLAGCILEDTWGRILYPAFYFLAGAIALQFHAWSNPGSLIATLGASGAVAALMGAFLVRFPKTKIEMLWLWGFGFGRRRFKAYAYWLLPLWLLLEVFYGSLFGANSGVAHWAHVGGFLFGAIAALGLLYSGLEQTANAAIEAKVSWSADPAIVKATEQLEQGHLDEAVATLRHYLGTHPDSVEACTLLRLIYSRKNDIPNSQDTLIKLCQLHLKSGDAEAAWRDFEEYTSAGGNKLPVTAWLELCRYLETQQNFERAVAEYERLAETYPNDRQSLLALIAAGRLSLKKLNRPADSLRYFTVAAASPVPHLDWEPNIKTGIAEAQQSLASAQA